MGADHSVVLLGALQVLSLSPPKSLGRREVTRLIFRWEVKHPEASPPRVHQWSSQDAAALCSAGPAGWWAACTPSADPTPPGCLGAGLTTQRLLATGVVGLGPGHSHESGLVALQWRVPALALQGDALHRHGALIAHAGMAVADPPLSRLEQTRSGSPRAPGACPGLGLHLLAGQAQPSPRSGQPLVLLQPPSLDQPSQLGYTAPRSTPRQPHHGCPGRAGHRSEGSPHSCFSEVGLVGAEPLTDLGSPSGPTQAGRKGERVTGAPGVCSPVAEATGHRDMSPQAQPLLCLPRGCTPAGKTGWRWAWAAGAQDRDAPCASSPPHRHQPPALQGLVRDPGQGCLQHLGTQMSVWALKRVWPSGQKQPSASPWFSGLWLLQGEEGALGPCTRVDRQSKGGGQQAWMEC